MLLLFKVSLYSQKLQTIGCFCGDVKTGIKTNSGIIGNGISVNGELYVFPLEVNYYSSSVELIEKISGKKTRVLLRNTVYASIGDLKREIEGCICNSNNIGSNEGIADVTAELQPTVGLECYRLLFTYTFSDGSVKEILLIQN